MMNYSFDKSMGAKVYGVICRVARSYPIANAIAKVLLPVPPIPNPQPPSPIPQPPTPILFLSICLLACNLGAALGTPTASSITVGHPTQPATGPAPTAETSPTPAMPTLTRLTGTGCCIQPFWSTDGQMVQFIDKPEHTLPTGIYGVSIDGGPVRLISERIGVYSPDGRYVAYLNADGQTIIEEIATGSRVIAPNKGKYVVFSPTSRRLAWEEYVSSGNFDQQGTAVKISNIDGSEVQLVTTLYGGGIVGWLDDDTLLLLGKNAGTDEERILFTLSVIDGTRVDLVSQQRMRSISVAPGGQWIAYAVTLDPDGPEDDGLWVVSVDGSQHYQLDVFGGLKWRDETRLLIVPMDIDAPSHCLLQIDAPTRQVTALTDPAQLSFRIAGGDWSVSPTGRHVVFLNSEDMALWLLSLPGDGG
ncbi:MAG: hypothetical protein JXB07_13110 [Anaerolineae bacterium]|nr:hypothetical protein [Anaerolineae bacterium]